MRRKKTNIRAYVLGGIGALVMGGMAVGALFYPDDPVDKRHCPIGRPSPTTLIIAVDVSDQLIATAPRSIELAVARQLAPLGGGDRIVAVDVPGMAPYEIVPIIDVCHAGDGDNTARNAFNTDVSGPIQAHLRETLARPPSVESPIIETILGIAADPNLHPPGLQVHVFFLTDALQNSPTTSVYRRGSRFPKIGDKALQGITIELLVVRNKRDVLLQPSAVERLKAWLTEAGATLIYSEPVWLTLAKGKQGGNKR